MIGFPSTKRVECKHCGTRHLVDVETEMDGDQIVPVATVDTVPCEGAEGCTQQLCYVCAVKCSNCDLWSCREHLVNGECLICRTQAQEETPEPECECEGNGPVANAAGCPVHGVRITVTVPPAYVLRRME